MEKSKQGAKSKSRSSAKTWELRLYVAGRAQRVLLPLQI